MTIEVGKKYKTRGGMVATITEDISDWSRLYQFKGFVSNQKGEVVRAICMWTSSGLYNVDRETNFDLLNIIEE